MTKKIRLIRTTIKEYTPYPEYYPEGCSIEEMAKIDAEQEDREFTFEDDIVSDEVKWEIIEE